MKNRIPALVATAICLVLATGVWAHHSQSEFDFKLNVDVEGTVTKLDWRSPHARLYVDVVDKDGKVENWNFELPSPTTLMRRGWTRESIKAGDHVRVNAARARNFPTIAYARNIKDKDGKPFFTGVTQIYEPEPLNPPAVPAGAGAPAAPAAPSAKPPVAPAAAPAAK